MAITDSEIIAELAFSGGNIKDYFLIGPEICEVNSYGEIVVNVFEEEEFYHAAIDFLRRNGAKHYRSRQEYDTIHRAKTEDDSHC
jgi:hypothetical protein